MGGDALMKEFNNKDFIDNDKFAIGVAYDIHSWLFGIDINFLLPGVLVQVGIGPFCFYIVW